MTRIALGRYKGNASRSRTRSIVEGRLERLILPALLSLYDDPRARPAGFSTADGKLKVREVERRARKMAKLATGTIYERADYFLDRSIKAEDIPDDRKFERIVEAVKRAKGSE